MSTYSESVVRGIVQIRGFVCHCFRVIWRCSRFANPPLKSGINMRGREVFGKLTTMFIFLFVILLVQYLCKL